MKETFKNFLIRFTQNLDRYLYKNKEFVIVTNNCWGGEIYQRLGLEYNSPFIGLFIYGPDYIKLLENFDFYINCKLSFVQDSKWTESVASYPIGKLEDIELHFLHYKDVNEALSKWNRRLERMKIITDKDKYYFKICDRDFTDRNIISRFHKLPFKNKISFGIKTENYKNHFSIEENENNQTVPDGLNLYRYSFKYIDILEWVNSGIVTKNLYGKIKSSANIAFPLQS